MEPVKRLNTFISLFSEFNFSSQIFSDMHKQRYFLQITNTTTDIKKTTGKFQSTPPAIQHSPVFLHG